MQWLKIDKHLIPTHLIPFADDPFGNLYCFSVRTNDFGAIYWLSLEQLGNDKPRFVEKSLNQFLEKLR